MSDKELSDSYRDDRVYVMRVESDGSVTVSMNPETEISTDKPVMLVTYRNLPNLPAVRVDDFPSLSAAIDYIKQVEPTCPRVTLLAERGHEVRGVGERRAAKEPDHRHS